MSNNHNVHPEIAEREGKLDAEADRLWMKGQDLMDLPKHVLDRVDPIAEIEDDDEDFDDEDDSEDDDFDDDDDDDDFDDDDDDDDFDDEDDDDDDEDDDEDD